VGKLKPDSICLYRYGLLLVTIYDLTTKSQRANWLMFHRQNPRDYDIIEEELKKYPECRYNHFKSHQLLFEE
jgi:hypothetical protein